MQTIRHPERMSRVQPKILDTLYLVDGEIFEFMFRCDRVTVFAEGFDVG